METEHFCMTRGRSYTVENPITDMGLKAWGREDAKKHEQERLEEVLSEGSAEHLAALVADIEARA